MICMVCMIAPKDGFLQTMHSRKIMQIMHFIPSAPLPTRKQTVKKVPTGRHARTVGTHTGKLSAESVRAALRRVRGSALNFVPRDCEAEARPADETAEAEQGQRSAFCKPAATGAAKAGNRNHQGEGISVPRMRAEMGSPWSVSQKRHAKKTPEVHTSGVSFARSRH